MGNYSAPTAGTFTISFLFAEAGQRWGYSINIGFYRNHTHTHMHRNSHIRVYGEFVVHDGGLFAGQTWGRVSGHEDIRKLGDTDQQ